MPSNYFSLQNGDADSESNGIMWRRRKKGAPCMNEENFPEILIPKEKIKEILRPTKDGESHE